MLFTWTRRISLTNFQLIRHHSSFNFHILQSASHFRLDSANIMTHVLSRHLLLQSHWILNMIHFLLIITLRPPPSTSTQTLLKSPLTLHHYSDSPSTPTSASFCSSTSSYLKPKTLASSINPMYNPFSLSMKSTSTSSSLTLAIVSENLICIILSELWTFWKKIFQSYNR